METRKLLKNLEQLYLMELKLFLILELRARRLVSLFSLIIKVIKLILITP